MYIEQLIGSIEKRPKMYVQEEKIEYIYYYIFGFIFLIFLFPLIIRRLHDLGLPGYVSLIFFILLLFSILFSYPRGPIDKVFAILICILGCIKGNPAKNKYDLESETNPSEIQNNQQK